MRTEVTARPGRPAIRRLALARLISLFGSMAAFNALAFMIFHRSGQSNTWVSAALLVTFGAQGLFSPLAGWLGDRFDRRDVWIWSELAAAAAWVGLAFAWTPVSMVVMAFVTATVESPIWPVSGAAIPNLVDEDDLAWANGTIAVGRNIGNLVGPIVGGVVVALLAPDTTEAQLRTAGFVVFGLNAASFLVAAWLIWSVRARFSGEREHEHGGLRAGIRFLVRERVLRALTIAWVVLLLGAGATLVAEVALANDFGTGSVGYGLLQAAWGGGAILGSLLGRRLITTRNEPWAVFAGTLGVGVGIGLVSLAPWFALAVGLVLVGGSGEGFGGVAEQGMIQRRTPDAIRSRVVGATEAAVMAAFAISFAFGGPLVDTIGVRWTYALGGISCLIGAAIIVPAMRQAATEAGETAETVMVSS